MVLMISEFSNDRTQSTICDMLEVWCGGEEKLSMERFNYQH